MAERTMEELLRAPMEEYGEAIVLPEINADHFEIKTNLLQLVQANPFYGLENENPHAHINSFKRITSTPRFRNVPNDVIKLMMFPYSLEGAAKTWMNTTSRESVSKTDERIDKLAGAEQLFYHSPRFLKLRGTLRVIPFLTPKVKRETEDTTDKEQSNFQRSTAQIPPPVIPISIPEPDVPKTLPKTTPIPKPDVPKNLPKPNIPYPSRLNKEKFHEKASYQKEKNFQMFQDLRFDISFADALFLMPKFAPTIRNLLMNKEKLLELAKIPLNENCSAMLFKKLPEKLGDPDKFLIPCNFPGMEPVQAAVDAMLPQIREQVREEYRAGASGVTDVSQDADPCRPPLGNPSLQGLTYDRTERSDKSHKRRPIITLIVIRNSGAGRDQRNRGQQSHRSTNSGSQQSRFDDKIRSVNALPLDMCEFDIILVHDTTSDVSSIHDQPIVRISGPEGITMDPAKCEAIPNGQTDSVTEVRSFGKERRARKTLKNLSSGRFTALFLLSHLVQGGLSIYNDALRRVLGCVLMQHGKWLPYATYKKNTKRTHNIQYHPGKANVVADALSRKSGMIAGIKVEEEIIRDLERLDIELMFVGTLWYSGLVLKEKKLKETRLVKEVTQTGHRRAIEFQPGEHVFLESITYTMESGVLDSSHEEQDDPFCQNSLEESSRAGSHLGDRGVYTDFLSSFSSMICVIGCVCSTSHHISLKGEVKNEIQNTMKTQQAVLTNQQNVFQTNLQNMLSGFFQNQASTSGTLPSNTILNPKFEMKAITTRSGVAYEGPSIPTNHSPKKVVERETEETTDKEKTNFQGSTAHIPPPVNPIPILEPDVPKTLPKPNIPYPSRHALFLMPRFAPTIGNLLMNKEKLLELAKILLNENCSAMLLKKLPEKLGDPGKFLIPCNLPRMDVCHALANLGAIINLMPLSIWKKLSLPELTPTRMTLELADRSITHPKGLAEDIYVKVGKFHFPTDFIVVDFQADPRVPLILGRSFLRTGCALIDVYREEITLWVDNEAITFNLDETTRYSSSYDDVSINQIDIIDEICEEYAPELLGFSKSSGGNPTPTSEPLTSEFILEEIEAYLKDDSISPEIDHANCDPEGDICLIEKLLNNDPFQLPPMDLKQGEIIKAKPSMEEPPKLELKDLPSHLEYAYLEENDKLPVIIAKGLKDAEKDALLKVLKSHKWTIAWKITDIKVIKKEVLKLLDARMIYPISDSPWVSPVHCVPKKGGITVVANEENELIPTRLVTGWRVCIDYRKLNEATRKDHFPLPFMDQMLERLAGNEFYCFLDGFSGYFQIPIDPQDQEKTTFTCPYGTFAYRRMPFGLCNAPGTFQRCMMAIFHDMIEKTMEVFMDDFSVFGDSFDSCLSNLEKMLKRCEDTNLVLNWEKCHFMCREGIVLGHKISKSGIEVDRAKVDVIAKLPHPTTVKGVRSFLGHAGFYRRFIQDFSKLARPMTHLLEKETPFVFSKDCIDAF
ncbi:reverse transcriptase domain-containing protein [Tanacetum coccineum]|uniref:Reverse transcriptase domain-containing protein n=1 Tax=Tanacetum coccineum TaxID=301880 RepID=A0ABQ4ZKJ5_9ASTR